VCSSDLMSEVDRLVNLVISGEKMHAKCDAAIAAFRADQKVNLKAIAKLVETYEDNESLVNGVKGVGKASIEATKKSFYAGKAIAKLVAKF